MIGVQFAASNPTALAGKVVTGKNCLAPFRHRLRVSNFCVYRSYSTSPVGGGFSVHFLSVTGDALLRHHARHPATTVRADWLSAFPPVRIFATHFSDGFWRVLTTSRSLCNLGNMFGGKFNPNFCLIRARF